MPLTGLDDLVFGGWDVFPDDAYGLTPTTFLDFGQTAHELGIAWGAAKAHTHLSKRREAQN